MMREETTPMSHTHIAYDFSSGHMQYFGSVPATGLIGPVENSYLTALDNLRFELRALRPLWQVAVDVLLLRDVQ